MISTIAIAFLIALAVTGVVIFLAVGLSSTSFSMGALHWLGAAFCVVVSTFFITAALGAGKVLKMVNKTAQTAQNIANKADRAVSGRSLSLKDLIPEEYQGLVDMLPGEAIPEVSLPQTAVASTANTYIESVRRPLEKKLRTTTILSIIVTLVLNILLLVLLLNAGSKAARSRSYGSSDDDLFGGGSDLDFGSSSSNYDAQLDRDLL